MCRALGKQDTHTFPHTHTLSPVTTQLTFENFMFHITYSRISTLASRSLVEEEETQDEEEEEERGRGGE